MKTPLLQRPCPRPRRGFSLIEVAVAIGLVAFSMLAILALLPIGLNSFAAASAQDGVSQIAQQVQADLNRIPFASSSDAATALAGLGRTTYYYSKSGARTDVGKGNHSDGPYFQVNFAVASPRFPGATDSIASSSQTVKVTVSYPFQAPEGSRKKAVFSLLVARQ